MVVVDLPAGWRYAYYPELEVVALASSLDPCEHAAALDELQAEWRARLTHLRPAA